MKTVTRYTRAGRMALISPLILLAVLGVMAYGCTGDYLGCWTPPCN